MPANSPDNKEQRILLIMRKLLASIVRETTPESQRALLAAMGVKEQVKMLRDRLQSRNR